MTIFDWIFDKFDIIDIREDASYKLTCNLFDHLYSCPGYRLAYTIHSNSCQFLSPVETKESCDVTAVA